MITILNKDNSINSYCDNETALKMLFNKQAKRISDDKIIFT